MRKISNHERAALKAHRDGEEGGWHAVTADEDRNTLRDAAIHLENSGMHEFADAVKLALVEYDGARSESRRFLDTRAEEEQRLADAEQRAQQQQSFVDKLTGDGSRYAIIDRRTGEEVSGEALRVLLEGREAEQGQVEQPRTLLGGARL